MAVDVLKSKGVPEDRILFLNLIASPEGVTSFAKRFPRLRVVTAFVDQGLDGKKCVLWSYPWIYIIDFLTQLYRSWPRRLWRSLLYALIQRFGTEGKGWQQSKNMSTLTLTGHLPKKSAGMFGQKAGFLNFQDNAYGY